MQILRQFLVSFVVYALVVTCSGGPIESGEKFDTEDDVQDPEIVLREKVNTESVKKLLDSKQKDETNLESRFGDDDIDDSADDYYVPTRFLIESDEIVKFEYSNLDRDENLVSKRNEYGKFYQGDMMLNKEQEEYYFTNKGNDDDYEDYEEEGTDGVNIPSRTGVKGQRYRWKKRNGGEVVIPYKIWGKSRYTEKEKTLIRLSMNEIEKYTCVRFIPRATEKDYILIYSGDGCSSFVGRTGGQQLVSLKKGGCFTRGIIVHELIHTIGLDHMHNSIDRQQYVNIVWRNIESDNRYNFDKVDPKKFSNLNTKYDLYSIMHYDPIAFSKNERRTIVPLQKNLRNIIGQRKGLSKGDITRINRLNSCRRRRFL